MDIVRLLTEIENDDPQKNGGPKAAEMVQNQSRYSESHFQIN